MRTTPPYRDFAPVSNTMMRAPLVNFLLSAFLLSSSRRLLSQDSTYSLQGTVVAADGGETLPFATVGVAGTDRTVFADSAGHFRLGHLNPGTVTLRARELGFAQLDTVVDVGKTDRGVDLRLSLARIPHPLPAVAVRGNQQCRVSAVADSSAPPDLVALDTELERNADRADLLTAVSPLEYSVEAVVSQHSEYHPELDRDEVDTIVYSTADRHPYRPGHLLDARFIGRRRTERYSGPYIYLPDLPDLSQQNFLSHHCLAFGGIDSAAGR